MPKNSFRTHHTPQSASSHKDFLPHPETGPRILFFSGGTALRELSQELIGHTHNSVHIITSFDSGGSSAVLRKAFHMPAIGDIRNRLMALADANVPGIEQTITLFGHRFPKEAELWALSDELGQLCSGTHPLIADIPAAQKNSIRHFLCRFYDLMPEGFDLRGASIGNLILAAGYLEHRRCLGPVIELFSKLIHARGTVCPVFDGDLHLAAQLENGETLCGQHKITGKESPAPDSPICQLYLTSCLDSLETHPARAAQSALSAIAEADLICFPMGSFYSSVIANLLPAGIGRAVAQAHCPKIFVPNLGFDPESFHLSLSEQVLALRHYLLKDCPFPCSPRQLVSGVLFDSVNESYSGDLSLHQLQQLDLDLYDTRLTASPNSSRISAQILAQKLMTLSGV
ncbi:GAK system CofD-like protein [Desulfobaculum bizertense]|uniref:GAK system CofD-like protein n=1 Tax=Desulfobaculum bizertense TaxID=376490 RepID=UPI001F2DB4D2|nr:GAK system CofD-like protein [Desulfobaculum bizertense]UIJ39266.1 GAK system CofD-like protein [Desulfobaculum bizertense]